MKFECEKIVKKTVEKKDETKTSYAYHFIQQFDDNTTDLCSMILNSEKPLEYKRRDEFELKKTAGQGKLK